MTALDEKTLPGFSRDVALGRQTGWYVDQERFKYLFLRRGRVVFEISFPNFVHLRRKYGWGFNDLVKGSVA
jgi:hypothetical protein